MHKRLLISLFTGVVLLSPCVHAMGADGKDAKVAQKEAQVEQKDDDKVAEFMQLVKSAVEKERNEEIGSLEDNLARLEKLRDCRGICQADYQTQKTALQDNINQVRQAYDEIITKLMSIIKEGNESGPESEARLKLLKVAAAYDAAMGLSSVDADLSVTIEISDDIA